MQHFSRIHEKSIEHNDIEPHNLVIKKNNIKIIDFGLAEVGHQCQGLDRCLILQNLKGTLLF
jgi:tRNA A-37 threonylcarbamoyl transferase component Bud32